MAVVWTDDRIGKLKKLWAEGLTTGEIGRRLDVSKNAVVGKAHRLGLKGRPSPIRRAGSKPVAKEEERVYTFISVGNLSFRVSHIVWIIAQLHMWGLIKIEVITLPDTFTNI